MAEEGRSSTIFMKMTDPHGYLVPVPLYVLPLGFSCLLDFYNVRDKIVVEMRPQLILNAEKELGIVSGLEDRVAQVYGGKVWSPKLLTTWLFVILLHRLTSILLALWSSEFFFPQK
ncbi:hypothetical protein L6452_09151 [Arctium lappa]|uniref:Uncharacterized protein n=1 Tax=Arctium lappa TaxID=4217 RepID=A0ACB9DK98_ARCLA|nr:hypothetical protein L6452_09151 [Arctium lappa]